MHALCSRFYQLCSKLQLVGDCKESSTMMQFTPPEIRKQHTILLGIYSGCSNTKISQCLTVDLKTVQKMWKELDKSNGDYKGTTTWKFHSDHFNKRTSEFLGKISTMIDNNPSKSIGVNSQRHGNVKFLIMKTFGISNARWERDTFYHRPWKPRKTMLQSFLTNLSIPLDWTCFSFRWEKFCQDQMLNSHNH